MTQSQPQPEIYTVRRVFRALLPYLLLPAFVLFADRIGYGAIPAAVCILVTITAIRAGKKFREIAALYRQFRESEKSRKQENENGTDDI